MRIITHLFIVVLIQNSFEIILDEHLQSLRRDYRVFRSEGNIKLDKSFFEIYDALGEKIADLEKPYKEISKKWNRFCTKYQSVYLNDDIMHKLKVVCDNTANLLNSSANMYDKALEKFFTGKLMKKSAPMEIFEDLCSEMETRMNKIWNVYTSNSTCVKPLLKSVIPRFQSFISDIKNISKITINHISRHFKRCDKYHNIAINYIENFLKAARFCRSKKMLNDCLDKLLMKEIDCSENCGRLYSSIRSGIYSTIETTKKFKMNYVNDLDDIDVEKFCNKTISQWIYDVKKICQV